MSIQTPITTHECGHCGESFPVDTGKAHLAYLCATCIDEDLEVGVDASDKAYHDARSGRPAHYPRYGCYGGLYRSDYAEAKALRFWDTEVIAVTRAEEPVITLTITEPVGVDLTVVTADVAGYIIPAANHWTSDPDNCDVEAPGITYCCTREPGHDGDHAAHRSDGTQLARWAAEVAPEAPALKVGDFAYFGGVLAFGRVFSVAHIGDSVSYGYTDISGTNQQHSTSEARPVYAPEEQALALAYWDAVRAYRALITAGSLPPEWDHIAWSVCSDAANAIYDLVNDLGKATQVSAGV